MSQLAQLQLHGASAETTAAAPSPRLVRSAHEFEASMMKELMAPLESGKDILGDDDEDSGSESALRSFAAESLGKAISEHGGFGIAKGIIHQLSHTKPAIHGTGTGTGRLTTGNHSGNSGGSPT